MITFSKFKEATITAAKRILKVQQFGIKTAAECAPFGDDSQPLEDAVAIFADTSNNAEPVVIGYINKNQLAGPGEKRLFSLDEDGNLATYLWLKADGTIELAGNTKNLVRYQELETAFNELNDKFNAMAQAFNSHTHISASPGSPTSPPASPVQQSQADITPAKINELKSI
jgi:hypothetical protein